MATEQLERSILERKERDELHAIASAMALKPASRSKKSDIIDLILDATGSSGVGGLAPAKSTSPSGEVSQGETSTAAPRRAPRTSARRVVSIADELDKIAQETGATGVEPTSKPDGSESQGQGTLDILDKSAAGGRASTGRKASPSRRASVAKVAAQEESDAITDPSQSTNSVAENDGEAAEGVLGRPSRGPQRNRDAGSRNGGRPLVDGSPRTRDARDGDDQQVQDGVNAPGNNFGSNGTAASGNGLATGPGGDLGNRRGRRRRGRDRERPETPGGTEAAWQGELVPVRGLLDLRDEGYGFLRTSGYLASSKDVYVSVSQVRRFSLRKGDALEGACRPAGASEKYPALIRIDTVGGLPAEEARIRPRFEDLTPLFPDSTLHLEQPGDPANLTARIVDLISPIGKGQRGMIVSPPKAGKTTIMKQIAHSIEANNPDVHLIVLLVDERPEEVTDMRRSVRGEVIASTFDRPADEHTAVAELTIERAKRLVELGKDVVIILDGITRLARAYNLAQPATGRIMSGGVDSGALYPPKRFFGAARNVEEGGSLTILATALVETGSKMDEVIFEEFKGTGNMELRLDRRLAERRLYPAIDVNGSSTRHEELLFDRSQLQQVWKLRRVLNALSNDGSSAAGLELLIDKIRSTKSNDEFLADIAKAPSTTA